MRDVPHVGEHVPCVGMCYRVSVVEETYDDLSVRLLKWQDPAVFIVMNESKG